MRWMRILACCAGVIIAGCVTGSTDAWKPAIQAEISSIIHDWMMDASAKAVSWDDDVTDPLSLAEAAVAATNSYYVEVVRTYQKVPLFGIEDAAILAQNIETRMVSGVAGVVLEKRRQRRDTQ